MQTEDVCVKIRIHPTHSITVFFFVSTMSLSLSKSIENASADPPGDTSSFSQCLAHMCGGFRDEE